MRRHELTDAAWRRIEPLLPAQPARGGRWADHRTVLNGILWKLATGAPWRDLPERYGNWKTVYERYRRWAADGTFDAILTHVQVHDDSVGRIDWTVSFDSTIVRAHQHAAGARKKGNRAGRTRHRGGSQALGRSRGGLTTKVHLAVDGRGMPLSIVVTAGNVNDCTAFPDVLAGIWVPRPAWGRPRCRPDRVIADKAYSSAAIRRTQRQRGIAATIPERVDQQAGRVRRGPRGGRPPRFDPALYKRRNVVERCIGRLKQWRGIATRFDELARNYRAAIVLVTALLWINT
ncbi:IS5 family transposase [Actinomadura luteofluorescens]|uniref:IS5 family transposase n=1 Tax=Actinomadura luteofluorescens TaxID=46163 RepID=UPI0028B0FF66|nr:IS5 family transposase [Actinomadura luteofluorescens]